MNRLSARTRAYYATRRFIDHVTGIPFDDRALQRRIHDELASGGDGRTLAVDRRRDLSPEAFFRDYYRRGRPVVLEGLARDWACVQRWTPRWLAEQYGDVVLSVMDNDNRDGLFRVEDLTVRALMEAVEAGDTRKYLRFGNLLHLMPELVDDFDRVTLDRYRGRVRLGANMGVFVGAGGTRTTLHAAPPDNLFTQVYGTKRWVLFEPGYDAVLRPEMSRSTYYYTHLDLEAPDDQAYPNFAFLDRYVCDLHPGDVLYNPPSWWHHVTNLGPTIGVGFRWMSPMAPRLNLSQFLLFFLATNPSLRFVLRNKKHYANVLRAADARAAARDHASATRQRR